MKTKIKKQSFTHASLLLLLTLQSCSSTKNVASVDLPIKKIAPKELRAAAIPYRGYNKFSVEMKESIPPRFENFDKKQYPTDAFVIANMIAVVQPELDEETRDIIATKLSLAIKKYNIEPQIFVSIIDTESNFKANKISSTGDLSIAQINVDMWNREFTRMNMPLIDKELVQVDLEYAFMKMAEILNIIKLRHEKNDSKWYARYHSGTPKFKTAYLRQLDIRLEMMAASENLSTQIAQVKNIEILAATKFADDKAKTIQANNFVQSLLTPSPLTTPEVQYTSIEKGKSSASEFAANIIEDILKL